MRYCSTCGDPLADGRPDCPRCAAAPVHICPACHQPAPAGNRFCGHCGARLADAPAALSAPAAAAPAAPAALSARRDVAVLFLDLTNFTAASHGLDSEEVFVWINETLRLLASVVHKYEGTIDKFTGDGLMALFGAPLAHENDPELAIRAALEMQTVVRPLRDRIFQKHGFDFQIRIGINTGPVIAGTVGDQAHTEYTVLGDTVNLASRLEKSAEPGTVLASAAIYQRTHPLFEYEVMPPLSVKGVAEPLQTFRPLRLRAQPGLVRGLPGLQAPMIGRDHLLAQLQGTLDAVRERGQHQVALITGEAGLGKSRLVAEFRKLAGPSGARFYQGGCLAYARSTPLWVVGAILRDILHLSEIDPPTIQRETLRAYLSQGGIADADVLPYLNNVLGLEQNDPAVETRLRRMDASMVQRQTHTALRQLFMAEAERAPTTLVFDDLHWVDPASRDFLEYLIQTTGDAQLMLVLVSRTSERETVVRPLIAAAEKVPARLIDIQLRALSDIEGELLVDQLIRQETAEAQALKRQIARRAAGNPFYIEEIIRILIDRGGLADDGAGPITAHAADLLQDVPASLKGLILTRFDRLPDAMRRTLQKAAVLGRSFPANLLQILEGTGPAEIASQFTELEARQFLVAEPFGWAQGYAFRHVLIQEAVYGTLLKRDRQLLHEQVAQLIERAAFWPKDEQVEVLAYHYAESASPGKAVPYLIDAAENAARRYANETAIRHYRRAIALMPPDVTSRNDDFFRVRAGLGQALKFVGEFGEAGQMLAQGIAPLQSHHGPRGARLHLFVLLLRELADVRQRERAYDTAVTQLETALQALGAAGAREEPALWRTIMDRMAWIRFQQGRLDEALELAEAATHNVRAEYADDPIVLASLFNTLGGVHWQRGDFAAAISHVERSLQLYRDLGYTWGMAISHTNLGVLYYTRGDWAQAASSFEQAYVLRRDNGYLPEQALNLHNLGTLRMEMGDHAQARRDLEVSRALSQRLGDDLCRLCAEIGLLKLAVLQSDIASAEQHVAAASALLPADSSSDEAIQVRWLSALVAAAGDQLLTGLQLAREALAMARASARSSELVAECLRVLGRLRAASGDDMVAEALFYQSIAICRQRNDRYRHGLALLDLGQLYERQPLRGRPDQSAELAIDAYRAAAELFRQLGAAHDLGAAQSAYERLCQAADRLKEDAIWHNHWCPACDHQPEHGQVLLIN